jgi:prevent-host-death family protein
MAKEDTAHRKWPIQDAEAHFRELLEASLREGPQIVTRQGAETAVLMRVQEWRRLYPSQWNQFRSHGGPVPQERFSHPDPTLPTLKELLLAESPRGEIPLPDRHRWRRRPPKAFE